MEAAQILGAINIAGIVSAVSALIGVLKNGNKVDKKLNKIIEDQEVLKNKITILEAETQAIKKLF